VSQYNVAPGGKLSPKNPATVATGDGPEQIAVRPNGTSVYVANTNSGDVSQYNVAAGGKLVPKAPATVTAGGGPAGIATNPSALP